MFEIFGYFFFFFQAEDGIRDLYVTGVQTCALPISLGRRATVRAAALINGSAAHSVEVDDIFRDGIYHPGAPTIAAALALAQGRGASGEAFLRAVIVGYEISTRIAAADRKSTRLNSSHVEISY